MRKFVQNQLQSPLVHWVSFVPKSFQNSSVYYDMAHHSPISKNGRTHRNAVRVIRTASQGMKAIFAAVEFSKRSVVISRNRNAIKLH